MQVDGVDSVRVTYQSVAGMREEITIAVQTYEGMNGYGVTIRRFLALYTFNAMPHDICILAEELMAPLIILSFHKTQRVDGTLDAGHSGFRYVNRKLNLYLQKAAENLLTRPISSSVD